MYESEKQSNALQSCLAENGWKAMLCPRLSFWPTLESCGAALGLCIESIHSLWYMYAVKVNDAALYKPDDWAALLIFKSLSTLPWHVYKEKRLMIHPFNQSGLKNIHWANTLPSSSLVLCSCRRLTTWRTGKAPGNFQLDWFSKLVMYWKGRLAYNPLI